MLKKIVFLFLIISFLSCEKKDNSIQLTKGYWTRSIDVVAQASERLKFNTDGSYMVETSVKVDMPLVPEIKVPISGTYTITDKNIDFHSTKLDVSDTSMLSNLESLLKDNSYIKPYLSLLYGFPLDFDIPTATSNTKRTWKIVSISEESLIVLVNNVPTKYSKE